MSYDFWSVLSVTSIPGSGDELAEVVKLPKCDKGRQVQIEAAVVAKARAPGVPDSKHRLLGDNLASLRQDELLDGRDVGFVPTSDALSELALQRAVRTVTVDHTVSRWALPGVQKGPTLHYAVCLQQRDKVLRAMGDLLTTDQPELLRILHDVRPRRAAVSRWPLCTGLAGQVGFAVVEKNGEDLALPRVGVVSAAGGLCECSQRQVTTLPVLMTAL